MAASGCSSPIPRERLGRVSDAESRPTHRRPATRRRPAARPCASHRRYAGLIHARLRRAFLAGTIRRRCDGRGPSRRHPHREPQSRARPSRRAGRSLAVVVRPCPTGDRRGCLPTSRPAASAFPASPTISKPTRTKGRRRASRKGKSVGRPVGSDTYRIGGQGRQGAQRAPCSTPFGQTRSSAIAAPWPTPTHIVASA